MKFKIAILTVLLVLLFGISGVFAVTLSIDEFRELIGNDFSMNEPSDETLGWSTKDEIWLNNDAGVIYFDTNKASGIRVSSGIMQCKNASSIWASCGGSTPGNEGWLSYGSNLLLAPSTAADGSQYRLVVGGTATTSDVQFEVIGATELDAVTMAGILTQTAGAVNFDGGHVLINDDAGAYDFIVEGDSDTALLHVDGSADMVGISVSDPDKMLEVGGNIGTDDKLLHNDDSDSFISFDTDDNLTVQLGGEEFINIFEDGSDDFIELGDDGDIDIRFSAFADGQVSIIGSNGHMGIGVTDPDTRLEVFVGGTQVKLSYDGSNYVTMAVGAAGDFVIDSNKTGYGFDVGDANIVTTGNLSAANYTVTGTMTGTGNILWDDDTFVVDVSENKVGIGTTTPTNALTVQEDLLVFDTCTTGDCDKSVRLYTIADDGAVDVFANNLTTLRFLGNGTSYFNGGSVAIGTSTAAAKLTVVSSTEQLRLSYDVSNYASFTVSSGGDLTMAASGGNIAFGDENVSGSGIWALTGNVTFGVTDFVFNAATSKLGLGTTSPDCMLHVGVNVPDTGCSGVDDVFISGTLEVDGATDLDGAITIAGNSALAGNLVVTGTTALSATTTIIEAANGIEWADNTLTVAESGTTFYMGTSTGFTYTLPPATNGVWFKFVVAATFTTTNYVIDSAEGSNIDGSLMVVSTIVECDAEDQINFVHSAENIGDWIEIRSNGANWFITGGQGQDSGAITCT